MVVPVEVLFVALGSPWAAVTAAAVLTDPGPFGTTTSVTPAWAPLARSPMAQLRLLPAIVHVPWVDETPTTVHPAGTLSFRTTAVALFGPLLVATIPYTVCRPTTALPGSS